MPVSAQLDRDSNLHVVQAGCRYLVRNLHPRGNGAITILTIVHKLCILYKIIHRPNLQIDAVMLRNKICNTTADLRRDKRKRAEKESGRCNVSQKFANTFEYIW